VVTWDALTWGVELAMNVVMAVAVDPVGATVGLKIATVARVQVMVVVVMRVELEPAVAAMVAAKEWVTLVEVEVVMTTTVHMEAQVAVTAMDNKVVEQEEAAIVGRLVVKSKVLLIGLVSVELIQMSQTEMKLLSEIVST